MKVAVVGGGLAGLAAALELVDRGADVTVHEARPTLGGAVQTLPERDDDPKPPPDNGQHIALGCFTEYLRFLDRVGEGGSVLRTRLALPVIDEESRTAKIAASPTALLRYAHLPVRDRLRLPLTLVRLRVAQPQPNETFGALLRRLGESDDSIYRFWDVFIRPALNLPTDEVDAGAGLFTVRTALLGPRRNSDLVLPLKPLGWMHGDAAGRVLGDRVRLDERVESLDDLDARRSSSPFRPASRRVCSVSPIPGWRARPSSASTCSSTAPSSTCRSPRSSRRTRTGCSTAARSPAIPRRTAAST